MMEMKKTLVIGVILLFIGVTIAPSINQSVVKASQDDDLEKVTTQKQKDISTEFKLESPDQGLYYYVSPFFNNLKNGIPYSYSKLLRDWKDKTFLNTTAMFIGGGVGIIPFYNVSIVLSGMYPDLPGKLDVYSDGVYYGTLYPEFWGPISARFYHLFYYEKGFHSLKFVAEDNTSLTLDVQIGWNGFINNIFPYLIKTG